MIWKLSELEPEPEEKIKYANKFDDNLAGHKDVVINPI